VPRGPPWPPPVSVRQLVKLDAPDLKELAPLTILNVEQRLHPTKLPWSAVCVEDYTSNVILLFRILWISAC
jgi:hypothetical protein